MSSNEHTLPDATRQFEELGYTDPVPVLPPGECLRFLTAVDRPADRPVMDWEKGRAATSRVFYDIATHPAILDVVSTLLDGNVILWGATVLTRRPDVVHPWHCDIETSDPAARSVTVWVGLEHTTRDSSLLLIPYSHKFGATIQEVRRQLGKGREDCTTENVLEWATARDDRCRIDQPAMADGWALFFDGRLWHGSHNRSGRTRRAVLLQYAAPDTPIRMPDPNQLDWPFRYLSQPRPPCLMLRGRSEAPVNRIVPGPVVPEGYRPVELTGSVYPLQLPLSTEGTDGWKPYPMLRGSTANLRHLACHVSALATGRTPHPPHTHEEEELLLLLDGAADLILPDQPSADGSDRWRLEAGQFVYYPAHFPHTLQAVSEEPANYLMFKWSADATDSPRTLRFGRYDVAEAAVEDGGQTGFVPRVVFQGPTSWLRKLRCHVSTLTPGAGYEPHIDAHDVAIVVLDGEIETLGQRVRPHAVVFCPAGEPHGMRNPGNVTARYLVFEFHSSQAGLARTIRPQPTLLTKLLDPGRWKRKLHQLLSRPASR